MAQHRRRRKARGFRNVAHVIAQHKDDLYISFTILGFGIPSLLYALILLTHTSNSKANIATTIVLFIVLFTWLKMWQRLQEHKARIAALYAQSQADLETSHQLALARLDAFSEGFHAGLEAAGIVLPPPDENLDLDAGALEVEARLESAQKSLGNPDCVYSARSPYIRCIVNPVGPCEGCSQFEPHQ